MNERVVHLGDDARLVGVLTEPDVAMRAVEAPSVILLSAGTLSRIGPHRVHVRLGRQLAGAGFPVLRFDPSGLGDSPPRPDHLPFLEGMLRETRDGMEFLYRERGARRFVLIGFCGGAEVAFRTACGDPRVVGLALVDWFAYPTVGWAVRRVGALFKRLVRLRLPGGGGSALSVSGPGSAEPRGGNLMTDGELPPRAQTATEIRALLDRGVRLMYVYTGGQLRYYNYGGQFCDAFPSMRLDDHVEVVFYRDADHTLTLLHHQRRLVEQVYAWALRAPWTGKYPDRVIPLERSTTYAV